MSYLAARRRCAGREISLDWRAISRREPRSWPGLVRLWSAGEVRRENARLAPLLAPATPVLIGTNAAGLLLALDRRGAVLVIDACELSSPTRIAPSFDVLERAFVTEGRAAREGTRSSVERRRRLAWARLDAVLQGTHALSPTANRKAMLIDIANDYLIAKEPAAFLDALRAFCARHPSCARLAPQMRQYTRDWGAPPTQVAPK